MAICKIKDGVVYLPVETYKARITWNRVCLKDARDVIQDARIQEAAQRHRHYNLIDPFFRLEEYLIAIKNASDVFGNSI